VSYGQNSKFTTVTSSTKIYIVHKLNYCDGDYN